VISETYSYAFILGLLGQSSYFFFQVAAQLYSRDWVDPVPDPLLLRKSGNAGNRTQASGSVKGGDIYVYISRNRMHNPLIKCSQEV
jgi:hypothetical protein